MTILNGVSDRLLTAVATACYRATRPGVTSTPANDGVGSPTPAKRSDDIHVVVRRKAFLLVTASKHRRPGMTRMSSLRQAQEAGRRPDYRC
ncbi:MAG: hypothetical protein K2L75_07760 [Muribaculaceae bacterium]|nr:hypothetical protein [Muribaculaceae bacterium]